MSSGTKQRNMHVGILWVHRHWPLSKHLCGIITSCKICHQKLLSLDLLLIKIVTKRRQQHRRVACTRTISATQQVEHADTKSRYKTKQSGILYYVFSWSQWLTRNSQKCFILHSSCRSKQLLAVFVNKTMLNTSILESCYFCLGPFGLKKK